MRTTDDNEVFLAELTLECGSTVVLSELIEPFRSYTFRCEGFDPDGVYATKLGKTREQAVKRWLEAVKWKRALHQRDRYYTIEARKNANLPQYFNGRRIK
ncbi:hypothetical protein Axy18_018 [Achromobacter phage vB_AxyS_19-32_Axy18]|nr:hypothetical protein Axy18_018 [Achromobacter phage vB_AxyS_19-32_Axy18]